MTKRKLIRSSELVNTLGHGTGKFNWTECIYDEKGILISSTQAVNLSYGEAIVCFSGSYHESIESTRTQDIANYYAVIEYTPYEYKP